MTFRRSIAGRGRRLIVSAFVVLIASAGPAAAKPSYDPPESVDDLFKVFSITDQPIDFTLAIDTSGSMFNNPIDNPTYPRLIPVFNDLVRAMRPTDHLTAFSFDSKIHGFSNGDVGDGSDAISKLPTEPTGSGTDIGAALEEAVSATKRAKSSPVQVVIVLTDGVHEPDRRVSKMKYPATSGPEWAALRADADAARQGRTFIVLGVGLSDGKGTTDIGLVTDVFDGAKTVDLPPEQLSGTFKDLVDRGRIALLRSPLRNEAEVGFLDRTIEAKPRLRSDPTVRITYASSMPKLDCAVRVEDLSVTDEDGNVIVAQFDGRTFDATVRPGEKVDATIQLKLDVAPTPFKVGSHVETRTFELGVKNETAFVQPEKTISEQVLGGTRLPCRLKAETTKFTLRRSYGTSVITVIMWAIAVVLAILFVLWAIYKLFRKPPLTGFLVSPRGRAVLALGGRTMTVPNDDFFPAEVKAASIRLSTRKRKWKKVYVTEEHGRVRLDGQAPTTALLRDQATLSLDGARVIYVKQLPEGYGDTEKGKLAASKKR